MHRRLCLVLLILASAACADKAETPAASGAPAIIQKIQAELMGPPTADSKPQAGVPRGEYLSGAITDSKIYPGSINPFNVYVPAQYLPAKPACLLIRLDGFNGGEGVVLDNLIARGDMPVTIAVGIVPGRTPTKAGNRWNRSYEFDSVNENFSNYVLDELLPAVEKLTTSDGRPIHLSHNAADRAVTGDSTGGIGSFTLAWQRPDSFSRVYSVIGTFVSMRGGHDYPALIRKTESKPLRIFLEDGSTDAWNPLFGSWYLENQEMEAALSFAGYDVQHAWGTHGHTGGPGGVIFPDVMRWLWAGWPAPVTAGQSGNDMLKAILRPGEGWQVAGDGYKSASGLAANQKGDVYFADAQTIYKIEADGKPVSFAQKTPAIQGEAFGPDGTLYATVPTEKKIVAADAQGAIRTVADGIAGHGIAVTQDGDIYVSEPGEHDDMPSTIWRIGSDGKKASIDQNTFTATAIALSPDNLLFYVAEKKTRSIESYIMQSDGSLASKEAYYWLHMTDVPNDSGAEDMAFDTHGNLYVATRMGVQVCDQNGRVRAILTLPTPCGPVRGICFGGEHFDILYVTDGARVIKRPLKVTGHPQWSAPIAVPVQGMW